MTPTYSRAIPAFGTAGETFFLEERLRLRLRIRLLDDDGVLSPGLSILLFLQSIVSSVSVVAFFPSDVRLRSMSCSASKAVATAVFTDGGDRIGVMTPTASLL